MEQNRVIGDSRQVQGWQVEWEPCRGRYRNGVCVFGLRDLPKILTMNGITVNKFRSDYDPFVLECIADILQRRSLSQIMENVS